MGELVYHDARGPIGSAAGDHETSRKPDDNNFFRIMLKQLSRS